MLLSQLFHCLPREVMTKWGSIATLFDDKWLDGWMVHLNWKLGFVRMSIVICPYSSTDRALVFGTRNGGSIPSKGTKLRRAGRTKGTEER